MAISASRLEVRALRPLFGAEVLGRRPDGDTFGQLRDAFNEYSVLAFRDQRLTDAQQVAFSLRFGPLEATTKSVARNDAVPREIADLSNVDAEGHLIPLDDRRMVYHSGNPMCTGTTVAGEGPTA